MAVRAPHLTIFDRVGKGFAVVYWLRKLYLSVRLEKTRAMKIVPCLPDFGFL